MTGARLGLLRLPRLVEVERAPATPQPHLGHGIAIGDNARGACVLQDVVAGIVCAYDPVTGARTDEVEVPCAQDPLTPGLVAVDESGRRALVMSARSLHADTSLMLVDLDARTATPVHTLDGPGWLVGAFGTRSIVVCAQRLGNDPLFSVIFHGKRVWSAAGMQQPSLPAPLSDDVLAVLLCPAPDAITLTGPSSLCVLDLVHGTLAPLVAAQGSRVRLMNDVLVVDGGAETVRARIAADAQRSMGPSP